MPVAKAKKTNKVMYQIVGLVVILFVLIAISTVATLILTGTVEMPNSKASPVGYIVDAEKICERRVQKDHGGAVSSLSVDDRSSLFDKGEGKFKLYYQLDLYREGTRGAGVSTFYVNCFVSAARGNIQRIEYLEQLDFKPKAVRREKGNAFGF